MPIDAPVLIGSDFQKRTVKMVTARFCSPLSGQRNSVADKGGFYWAT